MRYALILLIFFTSNMLNAVEKFPVDHFFKDPSMLDPQLSPDGNYLAALLPYNINEETQSVCKRRTQNFLKDLEKSCNCNLNIKLVIVNLQMPVMDAFDFTKRIKSHQNP